MPQPVEALLFDLDDTLCEYRRPGSDLLSLAFETVDVESFFTPDEYYAIFEDHVPESRDISEIRERSFAALAADAGHDRSLGRAVARAYAAERDHADVRWLPGAAESLSTLADRYPVGVVTNGSPDMQAPKLDTLDVADRFETVVHAGFDAAAKPDPEPYHLALDAVGVGPDRAVKIGNSLRHDVVGAHNAGLRSVWLDHEGVPDPDPEPHYRIESMAELVDEPWH